MNTLEYFNPSDLVPSPTNPRKHGALEGIQVLADSIRMQGLLQPIVVRPVNGHHEVVFGHRRREASVRAGIDSIPCIVRDYSDDAVIEAQIVENLERENMHPLDEAGGFETLIKLGRSAAHIADRIGRDRSFVAKRLKLLDLTDKGRAAFEESKLTLGAAIVLARVPQNIQDDALAALVDHLRFDEGDQHAAVSEKYASEVILKQFVLKLADAGWDLNDAALVPAAGSCHDCVKRTGNQRVLFDDIKSPALCTDPGCHRTKADALFVIRAKDAREAGRKVLEGDIAKDALAVHTGRSAYVRVDGKHYDYETNKQVEVAALVKKTNMPITIVQDRDTGAVVELVLRSDVTSALQASVSKKAGAGASSSSSTKATKGESPDAKHRREMKRGKRLLELVMAEAVPAAQKALKNAPLLTAIFRAFVQAVWHAEHHALLVRRNFEDLEKKEGALKAVLGLFDKGTPAEQLGIVAELVLLKQGPRPHYKPEWGPVLKVLGVNLEKHERFVEAEEKDRLKAAREREQAAAKKKAAATAGVVEKRRVQRVVAKAIGAKAAKGKLAAKAAAKRKAKAS